MPTENNRGQHCKRKQIHSCALDFSMQSNLSQMRESRKREKGRMHFFIQRLFRHLGQDPLSLLRNSQYLFSCDPWEHWNIRDFMILGVLKPKDKHMKLCICEEKKWKNNPEMYLKSLKFRVRNLNTYKMKSACINASVTVILRGTGNLGTRENKIKQNPPLQCVHFSNITVKMHKAHIKCNIIQT